MSKRFKVSLAALIVTLFTIFMLLNLTESVHVGNGFGRETQFVVETDKKDAIKSYLAQLRFRGVESKIDTIKASRFLITISVSDDVESFQKDLLDIDDHLIFYEVGTFGNIATYNNNRGFVGTYILILGLSFWVYFSLRYGLWGFAKGGQITFTYALSLMIVRALHFSFTQTLWYTLIVTLMIAAFSKHGEISAKTESQFLLAPRLDRNEIRQSIITHVLMVILGVALMLSSLVDGLSSGIYCCVFAMLMLIGDIILSRFASDILTAYELERDPLRQFRDRWNMKWLNFNQKQFKRVLLFFSIALLILGLIIHQNPLSAQRGQDFDKQNILVVPKSSAHSYLEVQAMLNLLGLYTHQVSYATTDQNQTWIHFDTKINETDLMLAQSLIDNSLDVKTTYFITQANSSFFVHAEFYSVITVIVLVLTLFLWFITNNRKALLLIVLNGFGIGWLMFFLYFYVGEWHREFLVFFYSFPLIVFNRYATKSHLNLLSDFEFMIRELGQDMVSFVSIVLMITLITLIVLPIKSGMALIEIMFYFAMAVELAQIFISFVYTKVRKGVNGDDDTSY